MRACDLLDDAGCSLCAALAQEVEALSEGRLRVRSLREPEVQTRLDRVRPGWRWEPMLLEQEGERVRVYTGLAMRMRLIQVLGPVRAWRVAQVVARFGGPVLGVDWGRRDFLRHAIGALAGWIALRSFGHSTAAAAAAPPTPPAPGLPPIRQSRLLEGEERAALLRRFQNHPDLQALGLQAPGPESEAIAVLHELADGNRLEAVAWVVGEKEILAAYTFVTPALIALSKHPLAWVKTQAMQLQGVGETIRLVALSVNGKPVALTHSEAILLQQTCPGCAVSWEQGVCECTSWNTGCLIGCAFGNCGCAFVGCAQCISGNASACPWCLLCAMGCPVCVALCCTSISCGCGPCPPGP